MIDLKREKVRPILSICRQIAPKYEIDIHPCTVWRWIQKGVRGVRLEHIRVGRRILTSDEAVERFFFALAEADKIPASSPSKLNQTTLHADVNRAMALERADEVLVKAGLK